MRNVESEPSLIRTSVVGITYANPDGENRQDIIAQLSPVSRLNLKREKNNPHDPNAVAVVNDKGKTIGYLARSVVGPIAARMDSGALFDVFISALIGGTRGETRRVYVELTEKSFLPSTSQSIRTATLKHALNVNNGVRISLKEGPDSFQALREILESNSRCLPYFKEMKDNLLYDIGDLEKCYNGGAYRASLAMAGIVLERTLKACLRNRGIDVKDDWMMGLLLSNYEKTSQLKDSTINNILNLINSQRIISVHAKEKVPIPDDADVHTVVYGLVSFMKRLAIPPPPQPSLDSQPA